jgi:hypothetical protein
MRSAVLSFILLLFAAPASATTVPGELALRANFETAAVQLAYTGDDGRNNSATLWYRPSGTSEWIEAHPLARIEHEPGRSLAGVIMGLDPDTTYDVRVLVSDPDGISGPDEITGSITTRSDVFPTGSGRTFHVAPGGSDSADGSEDRPLATIQHAVDLAGPGDTVLVHPGIYRESVTITSSGSVSAYLLVQAAGPGVILDGADETFQTSTSDLWSHVSGDVYSASLGFSSRLAYVDGHKLYPYATLGELDSLPADTTGSVTQGYYGSSLGGYHISGTTAYLVTRDGSDPDTLEVSIPSLQNGITVRGAHHLVIDGIEVRHYGMDFEGATGRGIEVVDGDSIVIRNCTVHAARWGIRIRRSTRVLVEGCTLWDDLSYGLTRDPGSPYCAYANPRAHTVGLSMEGSYEDHVIRGNTVRGFVDGIVVGSGRGERCENFDIHANDISESMDDALEMDCDDINGKAWGNVIHENHSAVSISGCDVGPLFVVRNLVYRYFNESYKLHPRDVQGPVFIYNNTMSSSWEDLAGDVGRALEIEINPGVVYHSDHYITFSNNIFTGSDWAMVLGGTPPAADTFLFDQNLWHTTHPSQFFTVSGAEYATLADFAAATGQEEGGIQADPGFTDAAGLDFTLLESSPAVDSAAIIPNVSDTFVGEGPDRGALERGAPPIIPDTSPDAPPDAATDVERDPVADVSTDPGTDDAVPGDDAQGCGCSMVV